MSFSSSLASSVTLAAALFFAAPLAVSAMSYGGFPFYNNNYSSYGSPMVSWCGSYYGSCNVGSQHVFAPYTSVNVSPYVNASAYASASAAATSYPSYSYPNSYPNYSYPSYSYSYPMYSYSYPQYTSSSYSYPSTSYYMYDDQYCYSGYGCYPFYVEDPHQWLYDPWTGSWY